jgi:hypothetical protein
MLILRLAIAVLLGAPALMAQTPGTIPGTEAEAFCQTNADVFVPWNGVSFAKAPANHSKSPGDLAGIGSTVPNPVDRFILRASRSLDPHAGGASHFGLAESSFPPPDGWPASAQAAPTRPKAFSYSNAYTVRRRIHRYASFATIPLFIAEVAVGQKLYGSTASASLRSAHSGLAAGIGVLFGVNSVTGVWNLWESRKDPNGRGKRMFHGILMLAADGGFVATGALAPHREERDLRTSGSAATHRAVALGSMGVAVVSYIYMLLAR